MTLDDNDHSNKTVKFNNLRPLSSNNSRQTSTSDDEDFTEEKVESTLRNLNLGQQPAPPTVPRNHKVVGRLSRWEGGGSISQDLFNRPAHGKFDLDASKVGPEDRDSGASQGSKVTMRDVVNVFRRSDALMEVTNEDIERVKIMHDKFMDGCKFSFNYNALLLIASIIAALGLGSNSVATIIASMLVSPLMGPVVGMAYANTIYDYKMMRIGFCTEVLSLLVCIIAGVIVGACMLPFEVSDDWPTSEMYNRGSMTSFWVGFPVAFFSGLGVAVSLLDEQTSSLVGVAISASLLPPAVNSGMLWVSYWKYDPLTHAFSSDWDRADFRRMGLTSLGLTLINIILIIISSMIMFRLKERLPIEKSIFWSDLGVARKIYRNLAIIPRVQKGPTSQELNRRATRILGGRTSTVDFGGYAHEGAFAPPTRKSRFHVPRGQSDDIMATISEDPADTMETLVEDGLGPLPTLSEDPKLGEDTV